MKRQASILLFSAGLALGVGATLASGALAEKISQGRKNSAKILLENEKVRVREVTLYPEDQKPGMHHHEYPHVGVILDAGVLKFNNPDGTTESATFQSGGAGFRETNVTHEVINASKKPMRIVEVEIK
jgi:hypothetical protein